MRTFQIDLHLSATQIESYYAGSVQYVWARDRRGISIQFPLTALRPFVTHSGVQGRFELQVNADNRMQNIRRIH